MEFYTLASSSSGNAAVALCGETAVLIDAGISARRITQSLSALGLRADDLDAVLVTHEHRDHIGGIAVLTRKNDIPVYATRGTARSLSCAPERIHVIDCIDCFSVGAFAIQSFRTSHDAAESVDYRLDCADGSLGFLTDTGCVNAAAARALTGVDALVLEANHDIEMLCCGPYPPYLKHRILSDHGHLSNEAAADFALECARNGTREIVLAHLSAENNTPALAERTVAERLRGYPIRLSVAPKDKLSEAHSVVCPAAVAGLSAAAS